ncbi:hypothetical protein H4S06_001804 [Coemansia sp. BCRC 34490]|nr:hypothetical protein H4S06_001804 [Coemansia sp. BCRC 34490]
MFRGHPSKKDLYDKEDELMSALHASGTNPFGTAAQQPQTSLHPEQQQIAANYTRTDDVPSDLPPAYSYVDPNTVHRPLPPPPLPPRRATSEQVVAQSPEPYGDDELFDSAKLDSKKPNELVITKAFRFDRPLSIRVDSRIPTTMTMERDRSAHTTDAVYMRAEVTSSGTNIEGKVKVTDTVSSRNEYQVGIESLGSFWSNRSMRCKLTLVFPMVNKHVHPGLCVELTGGPVEMTRLENIHFASIFMQLTRAKVTLSRLAGDVVNVKTDGAPVVASNVSMALRFHVLTVNASVSLSDVYSEDVVAQTSNSSVTLNGVSARTGSIDIATSNGTISCKAVDAQDIQLRTTNSAIDADHVAADSLIMETHNGKITGGCWTVERLLRVDTTNSKIDGAIAFGSQSPSLPTKIHLNTTNSKISVSLPADQFRGRFECLTTSSSVNIKWQGKKLQKVDDLCPINLVVDEKSSKRGHVGSLKTDLQSFSAKTTNSAIDIKFE